MRKEIDYCLSIDCPKEEFCLRKEGSAIDYESWTIFNFYIVDGFSLCNHFIYNDDDL